MRVTIILDSGGFMTAESKGKSFLDVGYFETKGPNDIEVSEDGDPAQPLPSTRLGKHNDTIDVEHLAADGSVRTGVNLSGSFRWDILKKTDLYPTDPPDFDPAQYDCILRFHSGDFEGTDVRKRDFKEHRVRDDGDTGNIKTIRPIANDVLVHYNLAKGEQLRLRRADGTDVWSSSSIGGATSRVEVKLLADKSPDSDTKYFKKAFKLKGPVYHQPNPDPPPVNGNDPDPGFG